MTTYPTETRAAETGQLGVVAVKADRVGKKYPLARSPSAGARDFWVLKDVSFEVPQGKILGVIGRNGAGKTTLLNMVAGVLSPTEGEVSARGRVLGLFNLGVGFQDELTGKENIFLNGALLGATRDELERKLDAIAGFSELAEFLHMPLGTYSQGMRLRLAFSIVANLDFEVLVLDEVLAVGDTLFQSKCFERLMDFRRAGKTLILTTQGMDLIERLCDEVIVLDHGERIFSGPPAEAIAKYRALLSAEHFYVGPKQGGEEWIEDTKKWTDDISEWGKKLGTRETVITSVRFRDRWGFSCRTVKTRQPLRVRVAFLAKNVIREPHFGIALFRTDGVYCYGPNTRFDRKVIKEIKPGKGWFELKYEELLLAPGDYKVSVAIWDKREALPFDYHSGYYDLKVTGPDPEGEELTNLFWKPKGCSRISRKIPFHLIEEAAPEKLEDAGLESVRWTDRSGVPQDVFRTGEPAFLKVSLEQARKGSLWMGLFREDGVYCQGFTVALKKEKDAALFFPELSLLPGGYRVAVGVWDPCMKKFTVFRKQAASFRMVFDRKDHGTLYLKHTWKWELPQ